MNTKIRLKMILKLLGTEFGNTLFIETNKNKSFEIQKLNDNFEITESFENEYESFYKDNIDEVVNYIVEKEVELNLELKIII